MRQRTRAVHPVTQWTGSDCPRQGRRGTLGPEVSFKPRLGTSFLLARPPRKAQIQQQHAPGPRPDPARAGPSARFGACADCAVGSGEWAEPPHYPWTFRRRPGKKAIFLAFFDPFPGRGRSCFEAALGPEEGPEAELGKPIPAQAKFRP